MNIEVEVRYVVNGTTCTDWFECDKVTSQILDGAAILRFRNGFLLDEQTERGAAVSVAQYGQAERILHYKKVEE